MDAVAIENMIKSGLTHQHVEVTGEGCGFQAVVVSDKFVGKNTLARHRLVYATLGEDMGNAIHALSIKALTPEEV
jgi:acid stress-induced BolA-like protein IbaG/YrbA